MTFARPLGVYIGCVYATLVVGIAAVALVDDGVERAWLAPLVAALIALSHLGEARLLRSGAHGESFSHEETYLVLLAVLASPAVGIAAIAAGFAAGNVIVRREPVKAVFNVGAMTLSATLALLAFDAAAGDASVSPRAAAAAAVAVAVFYVTNRLLLAGVLSIVGAAGFRAELLDEPVPRLVVAAADAAIGMLAAFAAADHVWTLPFGLAAVAAVHHALSGHVAARAEREKLAQIVDSSSDGIVSIGPNRRVVAWNPATERLTGYGASEILGRSLDDVSRLLDAAKETLAGDDASRETIVAIRTKSGSRGWIGIRRARTPEGGEVLLLHDETRRRELEARRARRENERLRADLVAAVSHELRTPLASILGFTQTLLAHEPSRAERRRFLEIIRDQGERLRDLIDDLLDLRTVAARGGGAAHLCDLRELVDEQVREFAAQAPAHDLRATMPEQPLPVLGERARLRQVLANLLSNAVKYSPAGGAIEVRAAAAGERVRVSVADKGLGIPLDQQEHVFERFFRVERIDREEIAGTGLGLALAREIVRTYGGELEFESVEGRGSTFSFELPLVTDRAAAAETAASTL